MIFKNFRIALGLSIVTLLVSACGGGGGASSNPINGGGGGATFAPIAISGGAVKGIIKNGVVNIYGVTNGVQNTAPLITGNTDGQGEYSLEIPGDYSGSIVIEITVGENTFMVCDVLAGCGGGVAFGEDVLLSAGDLELKTVVSAVTEGDTVNKNVTILTSMAAERAINQGLTATSIQEANSQVANNFGIMGDITELAVVDITNSSALGSAESTVQQAALISAAILSEGISSGATIGGAVGSAVADYSNNGGNFIQNESSDSSAISLEEIYTQVNGLINNTEFSAVDFEALETRNLVALTTAAAAPEDSLTDDEPSPPEEVGDVAASRALVNNIRTVGLGATFNETENAANSFISTSSAALELLSEDLSLNLEAIGMVVDGIVDAMLDAESSQTSYTPEGASFSVVIDGDVYSVDAEISIFDFVVNPLSGFMEEELQGVVSVDISLTGSLSFEDVSTENVEQPIFDFETETFSSYVLDNDIQESINSNISQFSGTAETSESRVTIYDVSKIILTSSRSGTEDVRLDIFSNESSVGNSIDTLISSEAHLSDVISVADIMLDIEMTQLLGSSPVSFNGELGFSVGGPVMVSENFSYNSDSREFCGLASEPRFSSLVARVLAADQDPDNYLFCLPPDFIFSTVHSFSEVSVFLNGRISQNSTSFALTLAANLNLPEGYDLTELEISHSESIQANPNSPNEPAPPIEGVLTVTDVPFEESASEFIGGSVSLAMAFDLPGVDPTTSLSIDTSRTGEESALIVIGLGFNNESLSTAILVDVEQRILAITDQNGNTVNLIEVVGSNGESQISGNIVVDRIETATIAEENGILIIRYTDDSFESLL